MENSRREFVRKSLVGLAALITGGILPVFSAKNYARMKYSFQQVDVAFSLSKTQSSLGLHSFIVIFLGINFLNSIFS
jgi:hypothetical protein